MSRRHNRRYLSAGYRDDIEQSARLSRTAAITKAHQRDQHDPQPPAAVPPHNQHQRDPQPSAGAQQHNHNGHDLRQPAIAQRHDHDRHSPLPSANPRPTAG
ncbi:hypothetical protein [Nocardia sp. alder85J]|uniref:hypothetical protein n=1 Tax=Nocardia sp. alder85J TaxID=2862949 RepID=UPI001CD4AE71|nr:hypothetical protein [Nocardia sp. alder85J]MCX4095000.1 hypothetical protein [Nocardia sp. alder85J]